MTNFTFVAPFKPHIWSFRVQKFQLNIDLHLTNFPKPGHIYKFCVYMLKEHKCLILLENINLSFTSQNHLSITILKHFIKLKRNKYCDGILVK